MKRVLIGCECSGEIRRAMAARGHFAVSVDLQPADDGIGYGTADLSRGWHFQGELLGFVQASGSWDLAIIHPECTYLARSGRRWLYEPNCSIGALKGRPRWIAMRKAAAFYTACQKLPIPSIAVENPLMHDHAMKLVGTRPHQIIQPWQFGHMETKATGFWLKNLPLLTPTLVLGPPPEDRKEREAWASVHRMPRGPKRSKERSRTFTGIAKAIAEQWGG